MKKIRPDMNRVSLAIEHGFPDLYPAREPEKYSFAEIGTLTKGVIILFNGATHCIFANSYSVTKPDKCRVTVHEVVDSTKAWLVSTYEFDLNEVVCVMHTET